LKNFANFAGTKICYSKDMMPMEDALEEHDSFSSICHSRFWQWNKWISSKGYGLDFEIYNKITGINLAW
jgi:hypothetical protein